MSYASENYQAAQKTHRRFTYYIAALSFTLLALSIQSVPKEIPLGLQVTELVSWGLLMGSGFLGLWRLNKTAQVFFNAAERDRINETVNELKEMEKKGVAVVAARDPLSPKDASSKAARPTAQLRKTLEIKRNVWSEGIEEDRDFAGTIALVQHWLFGLGVLGVVLVRAWPIISSLVCSLS